MDFSLFAHPMLPDQLCHENMYFPTFTPSPHVTWTYTYTLTAWVLLNNLHSSAFLEAEFGFLVREIGHSRVRLQGKWTSNEGIGSYGGPQLSQLNCRGHDGIVGEVEGGYEDLQYA